MAGHSLHMQHVQMTVLYIVCPITILAIISFYIYLFIYLFIYFILTNVLLKFII